MVSTIILFPQHDENIPKANQAFDVVIAVNNLATGQFTNPDTTYYSAPQQLNSHGVLLGHSHITIQVHATFEKANSRILVNHSIHHNPLIQLNLSSLKGLTIRQKADVFQLPSPGDYQQDCIERAQCHLPPTTNRLRCLSHSGERKMTAQNFL